MRTHHFRPWDGKCLWVMLACLSWMGALVLKADTHYVSLGGGNVPPYTNGWASAATNIQDAIDNALTVSGDTVLVSNGVYQTGGKILNIAGATLTNRVAITKDITVQSLNNDPANTIIKGAGPNGPNAIRGVGMRYTASKLVGFTVTEGATLISGLPDDDNNYGGGAAGGLVSNCIIVGNTASSYGGGSYNSKIYNSLIKSNAASAGSGGAMCTIYDSVVSYNRGSGNTTGGGGYSCTMYNCMLIYNFAVSTGGGHMGVYYNCLIYGNQVSDNGNAAGLSGAFSAYNCTITGNKGVGGGAGGVRVGSASTRIYNSVIYSNSAPEWQIFAPAVSSLVFSNSCTTNAVVDWAAGNITNDPLFFAYGIGYGTNHVPGNYHLQVNSPCVNRGVNLSQSWMTNGVDLDNRTRIRYGAVDMGAYEVIYRGMIFKAR